LTIMTTKRDKVRHQVKSRFYYMFWGTATIAVVAGQVYVGAGYRMFARSLNRILSVVDAVIIPEPKGYYAPLIPPPPKTGPLWEMEKDSVEWL